MMVVVSECLPTFLLLSYYKSGKGIDGPWPTSYRSIPNPLPTYHTYCCLFSSYLQPELFTSLPPYVPNKDVDGHKVRQGRCKVLT